MSFDAKAVSAPRDFLVLDLGAFHLKALFCRAESGKLSVVASARARQPRRDMPEGPFSDPSALAKTLRSALVRLAAAAPGRELPQDAVFTFSHRDFFFDAVSFNSVRPDPEAPVSPEEMERLVRSVETMSLSRTRSRAAAESLLAESAVQPVASLVNAVSMDRRPLSRALGEKGRNLKVSFLNAFAPRPCVQALSRAARDCGLSMAGVVPAGVALAKAVDEGAAPREPALVMDFGAEATTLATTHGQQVRGWARVPLGHDALTRMLERSAGMHPIEVSSACASGVFPEGPAADAFARYAGYLAKAAAACMDAAGRAGAARAWWSGGAHMAKLSEAVLAELGGGYARSAAPVAEACSLLREAGLDSSWAAAAGAARVGAEMARPVHDPVLRALRNILYRYE